MAKATQDLRDEHEAILYVLGILKKMIQTDPSKNGKLADYYSEVLYFLKTFADKCHHGKEENILFKVLISKGIPNEGGPVGVMLREHVKGREYIAQMSTSLEAKDMAGFSGAALQYMDLLTKHIDKENNVLFVMADRALDEAEQERMWEEFERFEEEVIGYGVHDKLHAMVDAWADAFDVQ